MMRRYPQFITRFYAGLLRLYPQKFRAEFSDEMAEVFRLKLEAGDNHFSPLITLLAEVRDLPLSLMREHVRERRGRVLATNAGGITMESARPVQVFQFFCGSLLIALMVFMGMVALPFFALGLHGQTEMEVISGSLGPEAFFLYSGKPNFLPGLAVLVMLATPILDAILGLGAVVSLGGFWKRLSSRQRLFGLLAVAAAIMPTLFLLLPVGRIVYSWWMN